MLSVRYKHFNWLKIIARPSANQKSAIEKSVHSDWSQESASQSASVGSIILF